MSSTSGLLLVEHVTLGQKGNPEPWFPHLRTVQNGTPSAYSIGQILGREDSSAPDLLFLLLTVHAPSG